MPRKTDVEQFKLVERIVMRLVVEKGIHQTRISDIAREAGVAQGYLYRHFASKEEMLQKLYQSRLQKLELMFDTLLEEAKTVAEIFKKYIEELFRLAKAEDEVYQFMFVMLYSYSEEYSSERHKILNSVSDKILRLGHQTEEVSLRVTPEIITSVLFSIPHKYLELQGKKFNSLKISDASLIAKICLQALR